ncbi:hypothetical protein [uncultured Tateyamaria sp.]|uniref:hypothetical protein n=1 Tax=uncultured Tateyamaria sp. TaxID=455651 RepID=UPI002630903C|nr:hypothetical protein [uncultured Tateyamaria sp.]
MNANQIINMIMRIVMRKAISKGIDAGMNRATRGRAQQPRHQQQPQLDVDDGPTQAEIRERRRARRAAREARQTGRD